VKGRPGEYKVKSNGVNRIINGKEVFVPFKTPDEVRIEMPELIQWYRQEEEKKELHPVELAAIFHFRFVTLHPFDDGNGRISRLLMNMILMRAGYVPAIIRLEEREQYIYALAQAQDGESLEPFVEIVAMETERSLNLLIKAAKGETIDEPGDLDKKISILNKKVDELDKILGSDEIKISSSVEVLDKIYAESIVPLMYKLDESLKKIDGLFYETQRNVYVNGAFGASNTKLSEILPQIEGYWKNTNKGPRAIYEFSFQGYLKGLKKAGTRDLNIYNLIKIKFNELKYSIYLGSNETLIMEKLYHQILFDEELDILAEKFLDQLVKEVEQVVDNLRNNGR
jgi:prophage maintenance system killer protein